MAKLLKFLSEQLKNQRVETVVTRQGFEIKNIYPSISIVNATLRFVSMLPEKIFHNERLTYRLSIVSDEAIALNDAIFLRETGCQIRELRLLRLIDDYPGTSFVEIAAVTGLERSLASRLIQRLLKKELIERRNSERDARVYELYTTPKGKEVRALSRKVSDRLEVILTATLSEQELKQFNDVLFRLGQWVQSDEYRDQLENA